jgi:alpha-glucosidase
MTVEAGDQVRVATPAGPRDVRAVLLDMDGTLVDSDAAVERAWRVWARESGVDPAAVLAVAHGQPAAATVRQVAPWLPDAAVARAAARQTELQVADAAATAAAPGAAELLRTLDDLGLPWAVVTGASAPLARARLEAAGITPPLLVTLDDVVGGKPDPEGFLVAAGRLGVDPGACLVVEDSMPGIRAGRRAGALVAALRGLPADLRVHDLAELAGLLRRRRPAPFWRDAVGYQVYLPSFQDGDGDGWGDLQGVPARLDHLADLGVDVVWLTPFYLSPLRDHGYDIADYRRVDPRHGGDRALDTLLAAAHRLGLRVIGDLVVNHTSDEHPWFQAATSDPTGPYRGYYIWRDPAPDGGPPNNWLSHFGGSAWTLDHRSGQYYLHLFRPEQPDLNWHNPAVADEVDGIIEHWLTRGLDGFRVDTAAYLVKHPDLPDNPPLPDGVLSPLGGSTAAWRRQDHRYDIHQPDVHAIHARWRRIADRHGGFLVGEVYQLDPPALAAFVTAERLHSSFWFGLVEADWDPPRVRAMVRAASQASPRLSWVLGNHDRRRAASRFGGGRLGARRQLALHVLTAFLPGTMWLYQGEELALEDGAVPAEAAADPLGVAEPEQSRDGARTPMPWQPGHALGFTTATPWLPAGGRTPADTVAVQAGDPASPLRTMRRLLAVRRRLLVHPDLTAPVWATPDEGDVVVYRRGRVTVAVNLGDATAAAPPLDGRVVFDTDDPDVGLERPRPAPTRLRPQQAVVLVVSTTARAGQRDPAGGGAP